MARRLPSRFLAEDTVSAGLPKGAAPSTGGRSDSYPVVAEAGAAAAPATEARLSLLFRLCLAREPGDKERATLQALLEEALGRYRAHTGNARRMATVPLGPLPDDADLAEHAAWTVVANVVMNLDEFLMRR